MKHSRHLCGSLVARARQFSLALGDLICGDQCAGCLAEVSGRDLFCRRCSSRALILSPPACPRCALPYPTPPSHLCGRCMAGPPPFDSIRAWALYSPDSPVGIAIQRFKYGRQRGIGYKLASMLVPLCRGRTYDLIVPVPLWPGRLRQRGFNQAQVLAQGIAKACAVPNDPFALTRSRYAGSQVGNNYRKRQANVAGAFSVARVEEVRGARVLLVDDVVTSSATIRACATALRRAGAALVDAVAVGRTGLEPFQSSLRLQLRRI